MIDNYNAFGEIGKDLSDVGRCRNYELLNKIYGNSKAEIIKNLQDVVWLKDFVNIKIKFNSKNKAAYSLQKVSNELNELIKKDPSMLKILKDISGNFQI
ncbi:hypothetical protein [Campylobacter pinnipediorum]|uniref:hypothetical protein n=1 Tax=Campylobacter pinnipediorum TaxID=1965231 RepID=UPI00084D6997|nr:hypothetical protein [Campylobacter pinnipediorum]